MFQNFMKKIFFYLFCTAFHRFWILREAQKCSSIFKDFTELQKKRDYNFKIFYQRVCFEDNYALMMFQTNFEYWRRNSQRNNKFHIKISTEMWFIVLFLKNPSFWSSAIAMSCLFRKRNAFQCSLKIENWKRWSCCLQRYHS